MIISLIVAHDLNRGIGKDQQIPWYLPNDLQYFKKQTLGHHLLMGRKTFESIGKPLPGRTSIVLSRDSDLSLPEGVIWADTLEKALVVAKKAHESELFVIGGGEIYRLTLPLADKIYLTLVETQSESDTFFPHLVPENWETTLISQHPSDKKNTFSHQFLQFRRKTSDEPI